MNWKLIHKDSARQPTRGYYQQWKPQIAAECFHQCVYCAIHEEPWGGIDHYHIDHYRPKSKPKFKALENDICNLFYACPVCNRFKGDDWPGEPDLKRVSYPDPSKTNYSDIFALDEKYFTISSKYVAGKYLIERLYLNRPQLIFERRESQLRSQEEKLIAEVNKLIQISDSLALAKKLVKVLTSLIGHIQIRRTVPPYKLSDIRKP